MTSEGIGELLPHAVRAIVDKKGLGPVAIDLRGLTDYADVLLIVSGTSDRHVQTIAEAVVAAVAEAGERPIGVEGTQRGSWALIDFGSLVVHVFLDPVRATYDLEGLWTDAPRLAIAVPAEVRSRVAMF